MLYTSTVLAAIMACASINVLAAPLPQLAGEGAACNSILSSTDNGVGYGIENAEDNIAKSISGKKVTRQLAGEGAACNSILSSTDNGVGYGIENAEDNTAKMISKTKPARRQLDKISNGFQSIGAAAGIGDMTAPLTTGLDGIDGTSTSAAADLGAEVGNMEAGTLEAVGSAVRRQLDKISNGFQNVAAAAGAGDMTKSMTNGLDGIDGTTTSGAADLGAEIGNMEAGTLEGAGSSVP